VEQLAFSDKSHGKCRCLINWNVDFAQHAHITVPSRGSSLLYIDIKRKESTFLQHPEDGARSRDYENERESERSSSIDRTIRLPSVLDHTAQLRRIIRFIYDQSSTRFRTYLIKTPLEFSCIKNTRQDRVQR